jgi:hypothetical protein
MPLSRRGFVASLVAAFATPALVRASSLEFVPSGGLVLRPSFLTLDDYAERILRPQIETLARAQANAMLYGEGAVQIGLNDGLLTVDMITREAVREFKNSNAFLAHLSGQYDDQFAREGAKIGSTLRIRSPSNYTIADLPEPPA